MAPAHADSFHLLGVIALQTRQGALAVQQIGRAIALDPTRAHYHYNLGAAYFAMRQHAHATTAFAQALRLRADYPEAHYNLGNALREQGMLAEAVESFRNALRYRPNYIEAHNNLGTCLTLLGRLERAEAAFRRALRIAADEPELHHNLGLVLRNGGRIAQASRCFEAALRLRPGFVEAAENLAGALQAQGDMPRAIAARQRVVQLRPQDAAAHEMLARMLLQSAAWQPAADAYEAALRIDPERRTARRGLAEAWRRLGRSAEAVSVLRELLRAAPQSAEAHNDLANALHDLGRLDEAIALYRQALALRPDFATAQCNLAHSLRAAHDDAAAEAAYRAALAGDPELADAHTGLGMLLLRAGRLEEGWAESEWRFRGTWHDRSFPARDMARPRWNGEKLNGRTLLVHAEQGYGDSIHFCRYVADLTRQGRVILEVPQPLVRLMGSLQGPDRIVAYGQPLPRYDLHCPMLSLPFVMRTTLANIPAAVPYLSAAQEAIAAWRQRLAETTGGLRVGLAWAGNPGYLNDRWRSADPGMLAPLATIAGASFISLQKPGSAERPPPPGLTLHDWTGELKDFADTAALISALDLVISTDTSVPHLAGALGKPVWLLTSFDACWRWLRDRDDSPWYPTLRLFRQPRLGDWKSPVDAVCAALHERVREVYG